MGRGHRRGSREARTSRRPAATGDLRRFMAGAPTRPGSKMAPAEEVTPQQEAPGGRRGASGLPPPSADGAGPAPTPLEALPDREKELGERRAGPHTRASMAGEARGSREAHGSSPGPGPERGEIGWPPLAVIKPGPHTPLGDGSGWPQEQERQSLKGVGRGPAAEERRGPPTQGIDEAPATRPKPDCTVVEDPGATPPAERSEAEASGAGMVEAADRGSEAAHLQRPTQQPLVNQAGQQQRRDGTPKPPQHTQAQTEEGQRERGGQEGADRPPAWQRRLGSAGQSERPAQDGDHQSPGARVQASPTLPPPESSLKEELQLLRQQLSAIPTKADMENYMQRLETTYKEELQAVSSSVSHLADRVHTLESDWTVAADTQAAHSHTLDQHTHQIQMLFGIAEDHENRNRRNNIRIRGIPETIPSSQLMQAAQEIFNGILNDPPDAEIEMYRVHRTLGPRSPDPNRPRDVLCRLHYFTIKEQILRQARDMADLQFAGARIQLLSDLSKMTLDKRRALRPILEALRERNMPYSWGYPFQLQVRRDGVSHFLRCPEDAPGFCGALKLPRCRIEDWPYVPLDPRRGKRRGSPRSPEAERRPRGSED